MLRLFLIAGSGGRAGALRSVRHGGEVAAGPSNGHGCSTCCSWLIIPPRDACPGIGRCRTRSAGSGRLPAKRSLRRMETCHVAVHHAVADVEVVGAHHHLRQAGEA
ncbi:hypothetical protein DD607_36240 [Salmonella sp. 3DZ2-4SM]|nr:hypothetical protein DD607_36240 [Salmonella sp. 3DZ2-4SM]